MRFGINFVKYLKWKKDKKSQKVSLDVTHTKILEFKCVLTYLQKTVTQVTNILVIA